MTIYLIEDHWTDRYIGDSGDIDEIFANMALVENTCMSFLGMKNSLAMPPENIGAEYPYALHFLGGGGVTPRDLGQSPTYRIYIYDISVWLLLDTRNRNIEQLQESTKFWLRAYEHTYAFNRGVNGKCHECKIIGSRWGNLNYGPEREMHWGWNFRFTAEAHIRYQGG